MLAIGAALFGIGGIVFTILLMVYLKKKSGLTVHDYRALFCWWSDVA